MMDNSDKKTTRGGKGDYAYIDVQYWPETVICHPELENQCPWDKIGPSGWHDILLAHPEFIRHAPKKNTVSFMNIVQWLDVLLRHPECGPGYSHQCNFPECPSAMDADVRGKRCAFEVY